MNLRLAVALLLASSSLAAAESYPVRVERGVRARMRDGVSLVADVYRPDAPGRFATLVQRTPYDRKGGGDQGQELAASGYVVVFQDTRGRFDSQGEFYPFRHELEDGHDTIIEVNYVNGTQNACGSWTLQINGNIARDPAFAELECNM